MSSHINMLARVTGYRLSRLGLTKTPGPVNLTYSVTNMCQSRCKTCGIWHLYQDSPERYKDELSVEEIEKSFATVGQVHFFNISGGEPFLRKDLPQIVEAACRHLNPSVIHTPTNAIMPRIIEDRVVQILEVIKSTGKDIAFTIKPSFDGVGRVHDEIRGVAGNFDKVLDTVSRLRKLKENYPNLEVGLGTIISKFNLEHIRDTARYAREVGVDSYISEIAEERTELFNFGDGITPNADEYEKAINIFNEELANGNFSEDNVSGTTLALRQVYYTYAVKIMREKRQVLPCYAGISNVHINPYGDIWPCCILGYDKPMGNLRDYNYDFQKIWHSQQASDVRKYIARKNCACPLANQAYSNMMCSPSAMINVLRQKYKTVSERR